MGHKNEIRKKKIIMYEQLHNFFKDKNTGNFTFKAFSLAHILYLLLIIGAIILLIFLFKNKDKAAKTRLIDVTVAIAFGLYMADFFLMPFSEGSINIDKLPFHLCTSMSILVFFARHNKKVAKFKTAFTLLGMIGALMYITYPAGVKEADGYSYRIIQTVLYHGLMIAQGVFAIVFVDIDLEWKNIKYDLFAILGLAVWAFIGNTMYTGTLKVPCTCVEGCPHYITIYDHDFNWFFVKHDALYIIDDSIDMYIAPFLTIISTFGMSALVRLISVQLKRLINKKKVKLEEN